MADPDADAEHILVCDDEPDIRDMVATYLERRGYAVSQAENATTLDAALEANDDLKLIILDINMPLMNGFEFLEAATGSLGENFAQVVVAMLTTSLSAADQKRAYDFPVVKKYINKPLREEHVQEIAELLQ